MIVTRKEKETNQQVLRRFNRLTQQDPKLKKVRDLKYFLKEATRFARKRSAVRKEQLRKTRVWY
jgi:ribosomal protein S21